MIDLSRLPSSLTVRGLGNFNGQSSVPIPVIIGVLIGVFIIVTAISFAIANAQKHRRQRRAGAIYQTTSTVLQRSNDQRLRQQYRNSGHLGSNAQRFPESYAVQQSYGDRRDDLEAAIGKPPPAYQR